MRVRAFCILSVFSCETGTITLAQLCRQPLLLLNRRHFIRELLETPCQTENCLAQPTLESSSPHTLLAIARSSGGVAVVPHLGIGPVEWLVACGLSLQEQGQRDHRQTNGIGYEATVEIARAAAARM